VEGFSSGRSFGESKGDAKSFDGVLEFVVD